MDELHDRLAREWAALRPSEETTGRARARLVRRSTGLRALLARLRPPRRVGLLAAATVLVVAGGALASARYLWDQEPSAGIGVSPRTNRQLTRDPLLSTLVWLVPRAEGVQRIDRVPRAPSLVFPPGFTYARALQRLYVALAEEGRLPPESHLGPPLPTGKVLSLPLDRSRGVALDLRAPWGYAVPSGWIVGPSIALPGSLSPAQANRRVRDAQRRGIALPIGGRVDVPRLEACQVMRGERSTPTCRLAPAPPDPWEGPPGAPLVEVPDLRGGDAYAALGALDRAGFRVRFLMGVTPPAASAFRRAGGGRAPAFPTLDELRRDAAWRKPVGIVALTADQAASDGSVLDQYPAAGARVRQGTRVVVVAVADDCAVPRRDAILQATCVPGAEAARQAYDPLRLAPWLYSYKKAHHSGPYRYREARVRPSLAFPAGTTYAQAIRELYTAAVLGGRLPDGATLGLPLPDGVVLERSADGSIRLDLRAPFGFDPTARHAAYIFGPGQSYRADLRADELAGKVRAGRLALLPSPLEDQVLPISALPPCEIAIAGSPAPSPCPSLR